MKAEELKPCDYVLIENNPSKIVEILSEAVFGYVVKDKDKTFVQHTHIENIKPIPLTEEILEKNGWKQQKKENTWYNEKNSTLIRKLYGEFVCYLRGNVLKDDNNDDDEDCDNRKDILLNEVKYVHRLQHILWVLDEEYTLNGTVSY